MNNVQKFVELAKQLISEIKKTTGINRSGITQAASLVSQGKVISSRSWNPPSAAEENAYIEENGMAAYGKWFLAIDANADMETKEHWHYIYTSDFVNVDRAGLIAIRQRSGQQGQTDVFNAAGKLIEKLDA
jgi:hypothetical protein